MSTVDERFCVDCKQMIPTQPPESIGTGYAVYNGLDVVCYKCCADRDIAQMSLGKPILLYLEKSHVGKSVQPEPVSSKRYGWLDEAHWIISNWPGTLNIKPSRVKRNKHNMGVNRIDVWFRFVGKWWHGLNIGDNEILRCKPVRRFRP